MTDLITTDLVRLDDSVGATKGEVIDHLAAVVASSGRATDAAGLAADVHEREAKSATGMPGGLAIPHCRSEHVTTPALVFARLPEPVDFGAKDGPADLVFLIAAPATGDSLHMKLLTQLARALVRTEFTDGLRAAASPVAAVALIDDVVTVPEQAPTAKPARQPGGVKTAAEIAAEADAAEARAEAGDPAAGSDRTILAVTACPTGIAHTFMAAEALEAAGTKAGVRLLVEPQGSVGAQRLARDDIKAASAIILATDVGVRDADRFAGLPVVRASVKDGIHHADDLVARAMEAAEDPQAARMAAGEGSSGADDGADAESAGVLSRVRTALLTGVSYMIPFVAAGGLLIAVAFLLGGVDVDPAYATSSSLTDLPPGTGAMFDSGLLMYLGAVCMLIGKAAFALFIPALSGYIAYALADRPGIAPGFVVGLLCAGTGGIPGGLDGNGAGFIGAIVGGLLAGVVAGALARLQVPAFIRGLMPVVIIPLLATLAAGGIMMIVLGRPLSWLTTTLQDGLSSMSGGQAVLLGVILGLMMCFDLGGPVNKAAYAFAVTGLEAATEATAAVMATVMVAGMVPPLALALASTVRPKLFTAPERENGRAAWLLGAAFISEGAIPFAAADPLRVIPAMMAGGAVTGGIAMAFDVQQNVPHGGVFVLFAIDGVLGWFVALAAGTLVAAASVIALKQFAHKRDNTGSAIAEPATA